MPKLKLIRQEPRGMSHKLPFCATGKRPSKHLQGAAGDLLEAQAALARAEVSLVHEQQRVAQLQVVLDQAAFRPLYANTVNPEPDRTAEEEEASENHLQLEGVLVGGDLFEKRLVSLRQIVALQLEWQLSQAMQNGEAEHFKIVGLQEDLDRYHEQLRIELATARSITTQSQAAIHRS